MKNGVELPLPAYKDRSLGLLVFGIVEILIGAFCALLVPLSFFALTLLPSSLSSTGGLRSLIPSMVLYSVMAAVFISLGIGSIRARRWARDLMLSLSWVWLLTGICTLVFAWIFMPGLLRDLSGATAISPEGILVVGLVTTAILGFIYVLLPGAFLLFYRSRNVAETCRERDPRAQWTDNCPPRLLTLTIVWALAAVSILVVPAYRFVVPFFGVLIDGMAGALVWVLVLATCAAFAWGTCRRAPWAWRGAVIATLLSAISTCVTFARVTPLELYRAMGLPEDQIALLSGIALPEGWAMAILWALMWSTMIGYLVSVRGLFAWVPEETTD
jgi:hypothetical protein